MLSAPNFQHMGAMLCDSEPLTDSNCRLRIVCIEFLLGTCSVHLDQSTAHMLDWGQCIPTQTSIESPSALSMSIGWFNTSPWCNALAQPSMCLLLRSTCTQHITLCTKYEFLQFWNRIFTIKMWGHSKFTLTYGYLMSVKLCPIKSEVNSHPKMAKLFWFQNSNLSHDFQWLLLAATVEI